MKNLKLTLFLVFLLSYSTILIAQNNSFVFEKTSAIRQEVTFISQIYSKPNIREVKLPNGQTATINNIGGSRTRQHLRISDIVIKPSKEKISLGINTKRIKNDAYGIAIDTDTPFTTDQQTQATLDTYLNQLGEIRKLTISTDKMVSPKPLEEVVWGGPLLNPIHELSGVLLANTLINLQKGKVWQDTIKGIYNAYINSYEVIEINNEDFVVALSGYLEKTIPQSLPNDEVVDFKSVVESGKKIEPVTVINSAKYTGKIVVSAKSMLIKEMNILMHRSETVSLFGSVVPKTLDIEFTIKNRVVR
ncbi:hypothetical protein [Emticicia fluvialis]|uniref:hypothetical protein n=1 Tax=Emticicia fluvialis TaxID=2974474 RepID=UPI0021658630|nr:hypothetical protein [Emticicia fluvialis]